MDVKVKPLEWIEDDTRWWVAQMDPRLPGYEVRETDRGNVRARIAGEPWSAFTGTVEEAKAIAQADFERRILTALIPPPSEDRP